MKKYQPVSCDFVDQIEIAALQGKTGVIQYLEEDREIELTDRIKTWITDQKIEYLLTVGGARIRLDQITWLIDQPGPRGKC